MCDIKSVRGIAAWQHEQVKRSSCRAHRCNALLNKMLPLVHLQHMELEVLAIPQLIEVVNLLIDSGHGLSWLCCVSEPQEGVIQDLASLCLEIHLLHLGQELRTLLTYGAQLKQCLLLPLIKPHSFIDELLSRLTPFPLLLFCFLSVCSSLVLLRLEMCEVLLLALHLSVLISLASLVLHALQLLLMFGLLLLHAPLGVLLHLPLLLLELKMEFLLALETCHLASVRCFELFLFSLISLLPLKLLIR
mmetsp:Transcript_46783/g.85632  ORF Transcript_46783/g.85632 Transcript_46783/m.85632 type:complete len:247 (-) Transcript_46783:1553-2293(-)